MQVLGHRGWPTPAHPENTLAAVEAALSAGAQGVEVDVRISADGVAVCVHDPDLLRTGGVPHVVRRTSAEALRDVVLTGGHRPPLLEQVVRSVAGRGLLVLDIKPDHRSALLVRAVLDALDGLPAAEVVLSSTERRVLRAFAAASPDLPLALVTGVEVPAHEALAEARAHADDALHLNVRALLDDPSAAAAARRAGLCVRAWTVNRVVDARLLRALELDAVLTDVPATLLRELAAARAF